jgi:hypothetical protein
MKIHRVVIRDKQNNLKAEIKFCNGILYRQNRSYDTEICLDDFIDRLRITKEQAEKEGFIVIYDILDNDVKWLTK